ncbi:MAG: hypothetical protein HZC36_07310 [Armatimonadetes bacterium]|nr:hypothetical protein [Armatimonadota bacterium]
MGTKIWVYLIGMMAAGIGLPMLLAYQLKLGDFAKSPQEVRLNLGGSLVVAGGRAKIWFAQVDPAPTLEISCAKETATVELDEEEPSQEVCGVQVRKLDIKEVQLGVHRVLQGHFEVTWKNPNK